jgi:hypothetical protein
VLFRSGVRLLLRAEDALVLGPGDRERVISLDEVLDHPVLSRWRPIAIVELVNARRALKGEKPRSPYRLVLEAAAIEAAIHGGFNNDPDQGSPCTRIFVVLDVDKRPFEVFAIKTSKEDVANLLAVEPKAGSLWVFAVPTHVVETSDRFGARYPIIDKTQVAEQKRPARWHR